MKSRPPIEGAVLACLVLLLSGSASAQAPVAPSLNPLAGIAAEATSAFTERPLFSESRRPVSRLVMPALVAAPPTAPSIPTTANLQLVGIVQSGQGALARIIVAGSGEAQAVRSGETVSGWTVTAIAPAAVSLEQGDHVASLELFTPGPSVQPPSTAPVAPAGSASNPVAPAPARAAPANGGAAPPGTVPGTAAAEAAANAPFSLTFGGTPQ